MLWLRLGKVFPTKCSSLTSKQPTGGLWQGAGGRFVLMLGQDKHAAACRSEGSDEVNTNS